MKISQEPTGEGVKIVLQGELTLQTYAQLEAALKEAVESKLKNVVVDMRKVDYVDSSGLRLLVDYHHQFSYLQGKLVLSGVTPSVRKVIEVTHLNQVFTIQDDPDSSYS